MGNIYGFSTPFRGLSDDAVKAINKLQATIMGARNGMCQMSDEKRRALRKKRKKNKKK